MRSDGRLWLINRPRIAVMLFMLAAPSLCAAAAGTDSSYAHCADQSDPPRCILKLAALQGGVDPTQFLEAVITTGGVDAVVPHHRVLVRQARSSVRLRRDIEPSAAVFLAAVALAAAAQSRDDPFNEPLVSRLIAKSHDAAAVARVAGLLWIGLDTYYEWNGALTLPRGLSPIWLAIAASPPADSRLLLRMALDGEYSGQGRQESLLLLRKFEKRSDAAPDLKAEASVIAQRYTLPDEAQQLMEAGGKFATGYDIESIQTAIAEAELKGGYDTRAARKVVEHAMGKLDEPAYQSSLDTAPYDALEAGGAKVELKALGDVYLKKASEDGTSENRGDWYALASDCYRRAEENELAIRAARLGLPLVPDAVAGRLGAGGEKKTHQQQAVDSNGYGAAPVLALYRAGAVSEALQAGYLNGRDRFWNAKLAGEIPDPGWVVSDRSWFNLGIIVRQLIQEGSVSVALDLQPKLEAAMEAPGTFSGSREYALLAQLAALTSQPEKMNFYLSREATGVDDPDSALALASKWRLCQTILARVKPNYESAKKP